MVVIVEPFLREGNIHLGCTHAVRLILCLFHARVYP